MPLRYLANVGDRFHEWGVSGFKIKRGEVLAELLIDLLDRDIEESEPSFHAFRDKIRRSLEYFEYRCLEREHRQLGALKGNAQSLNNVSKEPHRLHSTGECLVDRAGK